MTTAMARTSCNDSESTNNMSQPPQHEHVDRMGMALGVGIQRYAYNSLFIYFATDYQQDISHDNEEEVRPLLIQFFSTHQRQGRLTNNFIIVISE
jgi:hypothetical protein